MSEQTLREVAFADDLSVGGIVFNIQKYSIHDGPGIRTIVFFKGCPLRCLWCSNPESQSVDVQVLYSSRLCEKCFSCVSACRFDAIHQDEEFTLRIDYRKCTTCMECVEVCPTGALRTVGQTMTVADVYRAVAQDRVFYRKSRGGVTISGGEPFFQFDFLKSLLRVLHGRYIHTAVETCGHTEWSRIEELLPHIDLMLFDLKVNDSHRHVEYTGVDNSLIIDNFKRLLASEVPLWIRLPIIPGYNDDSGNISFISELVGDAKNVRRISLLPYHQYGINKYAGIGSIYSLHDVAPPSKESLSKIEAGFRGSLPAVEIEIGG